LSGKNATKAAFMNAKRWFVWVCLALLLVTEAFLFHANHEREQAWTDLRDVQAQLHAAERERDDLKNSSTGQQAATIASLRKQNELLTAKVNGLQAAADRLKAESQQTAQHLNTARTALELQQASLQALQAEQQRAALAANAATCISNLRQIESAKDQWALEKNKGAADVPAVQDLLPFLKDNVFPVCPDGGTYTINPAGKLPTCSVPGHALPPQ
jgi:chromosome segregation ATPase